MLIGRLREIVVHHVISLSRYLADMLVPDVAISIMSTFSKTELE